MQVKEGERSEPRRASREERAEKSGPKRAGRKVRGENYAVIRKSGARSAPVYSESVMLFSARSFRLALLPRRSSCPTTGDQPLPALVQE